MGAGACCAYDDDFGMLLHDFLIHIAEALAELGRDTLFVANAQVLQSEGLGVAGLGAYASPLGVRVAVSPLNKVQRVLYPLVHLRHGDHVLGLVFHAPAAIGTLAGDSAGQDGQGGHAEVFAELEVLIVA